MAHRDCSSCGGVALEAEPHRLCPDDGQSRDYPVREGLPTIHEVTRSALQMLWRHNIGYAHQSRTSRPQSRMIWGHPATASKVRPNAGFVGRHECAKYCDGSKAFPANCEPLGVSTWAMVVWCRSTWPGTMCCRRGR